MALRPGARIPVPTDVVFPHGVFAAGVAPVMSFTDGKSTGMQELDAHTSQPVWAVSVIDADPELPAKLKSFVVKVSAPYQPVLPDPQIPGLPFVPVLFEGLTVTPYVDNASKRLAYSYRATGVGPVITVGAPQARSGRVTAPAAE
ncbi:plasmid replication, integration and excision activator [Kitasatospora sp. NPDC101235]|uniref:plasmid replication, integration and excision activator n=1 Tax=Kitasatospora sp. NPDC101235 TaxID=3364101 RepID=UPI0037FCCE15